MLRHAFHYVVTLSTENSLKSTKKGEAVLSMLVKTTLIIL